MELFHLNLNAVRGLIIVFRLSLLWVNVNEIHVRIEHHNLYLNLLLLTIVFVA